MERRGRQRKRYQRVCRYCGDSYMAKRADGVVCYSEACQRQAETERKRVRYKRRKERGYYDAP